MSSESSGSPKVIRIAVTTVLAAGVPFIAFLTGFAQRSPVSALIIVVVWEIIVGLGAIASNISKKLSDLWVERLTKLTDNTLTRLVSRYPSAYKRHIRAANSHMEQLGLATRSEYALGLRDIYITLSLDPNAVHTLSTNPLSYRSEQATTNSDTIWEWIVESRKYENVLAIVGPPGSGKTTILKHVALIMADSRPRHLKKLGIPRRTLPVILTLRDLKSHFQEENSRPSLPGLIRHGLSDLDRREPPSWVEWNLRRNRFLLMFDGLDEVASDDTRRRISAWIDRQQEIYPEAHFVVTSRPFGYQAAPLKAATVVQVRPFSEKEIKQFISRWYRATAQRRYGEMSDAAKLYASTQANNMIANINWSADVLELAVNPLLLTMVCNVHEYRGALPGTRLELYKEICDVLLSRRNQARGIDHAISGIKKQAVLQKLALHLMQKGSRDAKHTDLDEIIGDTVARVASNTSALELIQEIEKSSGLIVEREANVYGFAHLSFQEYLASVEIVETQEYSLLYSNLADSWWRETILLFAAQSDATQIVERCLQHSQDLSMLSLAVTCSDVSREISASARGALARFTQGNIEDDTERRRTAGGVQIFSRMRSFTRVAADTYVSRRPITWVEYQMFLDETISQCIPDHWAKNSFPSGKQNDPAVGMRMSDSLQFCNWIEMLYRDGWAYRLLDVELVRALHASAFLEEDGVHVAYALNDTTSFRDARPEEESVGTIEIRRSFAAVSLSTSDIYGEILEIVKREMNSDRQLLRSRIDEIDQSGLDESGAIGSDIANYLINDQNQDAGLFNALKALIRATPWLDLSDSNAFAESAAPLVRSLATEPRFDAVRDELWKLSALAEIVASGLAIALNRSTAPQSRIHNCREERTTARLAAVAAYRKCAQLKDFAQLLPEQSRVEPSTIERTYRWMVAHLRRSSSSESRTDPMVGEQAEAFDAGYSSSPPQFYPDLLASYFLRVYYALLLLESRIEARSEPWEGLFICRMRE